MQSAAHNREHIYLCKNECMTLEAADSSASEANRILNGDTWVIIPLYNEASMIGSVIADVKSAFSNVVCVDDGSHDGSGYVAKAAGARVVTHPINLGQGAALQTGFDFALERGAEYVVTFDADGQHQIVDAASMLKSARDVGAAIVFGSRFLDDRTRPGFLKKVVLKVAVTATNWTTRTNLTDAHNGLRVIRRDALQCIRLKQDRMAHGTEIVVQLGRTKLPYIEHPVEVIYTDYSRAKGQSLLNSVNILIDLIIR